jgi:riboflavin kinase/FMN adenylyltransferase
MQLVRGLHNLRQAHRGCVATIGNFDGVHLGHQAVFARLCEHGRQLGEPATVITFEPQPQEYFVPEAAPARLTRLREKVTAIRATGVDRLLVLEFGARLAAMPAEAFVSDLLVGTLGIRHLYVGDDFRFGQGRRGDVELLRQAGARHGFAVDRLDTVAHENARISSSRIRAALEEGDFATAAACLGRPYRICGRVVHGRKLGRGIGFPTANVDLHRRVSPVRGVFAVRVLGIDPVPLPGVANVGNRPTVDGGSRDRLEVHLFDFARDVYGAHVEVEFVRKIREERKFPSFEDLRRQIELDARTARGILVVNGQWVW